MVARFFIDRPVLAWVISVVIILLGAIAAGFLPVGCGSEHLLEAARLLAGADKASRTQDKIKSR